MYTKEEKKLILSCISAAIETGNRAAGKTKRPEFKVIYEREVSELHKLRAKVETMKDATG